MTSDEVENAIRRNITWAKLSEEMRSLLGNSQREYDKRILDYSIRNQLRYKENIVRFIKKNQEEYYESLLQYSKAKMMLYPYHLSDILVRELRVTPFTYYTDMMIDVMQSEKSYDSIPNFTAVDCMRILGVGRNQYIDLMNQNRANRRLFRRSKSIREILPQKPANIAPIEPWFLLCYGCIMEQDLLSSVEKELIDRLMDEGPILCGLLDKGIVQRLLSRGLVYIDVPINSSDYVYVPTLDGFVMNRVQGDYFETLLYKIFVAIDGQNTIKEFSDTIDIDIELVKNAVSVFCRLGFVRKRVTGIENIALDTSWSEYYSNAINSSPTSPTSERSTTPEPSPLNAELTSLTHSLMHSSTTNGGDLFGDDDDGDIVAAVENVLKSGGSNSMDEQRKESAQSPTSQSVEGNATKRIAFVFDSTLTAFLMMGNLSASLKNHAVTLFEVGKLSDDALDSFIEELQNVNFFAEGEAQRYSEHARTLLHTIQCIRSGAEMDLIRGESLMNLEAAARLRVVEKSYKLLISMAPIGAEACCLHFSTLPQLGTASVELTSPWFRLFLYELASCGPPSLFLPMGTHCSQLPRPLWKCQRLMLTQGAHEPMIFPVECALVPVQEALLCAPVFLQAYSEDMSDAEIVNIPFPFDDEEQKQPEKEAEGQNDSQQPQPFTAHPVVRQLHAKLGLDRLCGYLVLLKLYNNGKNAGNEKHDGSTTSLNSSEEEEEKLEENGDSLNVDEPTGKQRLPSPSSMYSLNKFQMGNSITKDPKKTTTSNRTHLRRGESFDDFVLLDCLFGIPLFDERLNRVICQRILQSQLLAAESYQNTREAMQLIIDSTKQFIRNFQVIFQNVEKPQNFQSFPPGTNTAADHSVPNPTSAVLFDPNCKSNKCELYQQNSQRR